MRRLSESEKVEIWDRFDGPGHQLGQLEDRGPVTDHGSEMGGAGVGRPTVVATSKSHRPVGGLILQ